MCNIYICHPEALGEGPKSVAKHREYNNRRLITIVNIKYTLGSLTPLSLRFEMTRKKDGPIKRDL